VCRIETLNGVGIGTGFVVAPSQVLTCYHVVDPDGRGPRTDLMMRFRCLSGEARGTSEPVLLSRNPFLATSPVRQLDYALLDLAAAATDIEGVVLAHIGAHAHPGPGDPLSVLQHPGGDTMKLALSDDGINKVNFERGLMQYVASTAGGSSGAPCFDEKWRVVALHHAEVARAFGSVREGVLMSAIVESAGISVALDG